MNADGFAGWLASAAAGAVIHADNDAAGQRAASRLCGCGTHSRRYGSGSTPSRGQGCRCHLRHEPLRCILTESWPGYADTLAEANGWPRWEAQRQAALLMDEVPA